MTLCTALYTLPIQLDRDIVHCLVHPAHPALHMLQVSCCGWISRPEACVTCQLPDCKLKTVIQELVRFCTLT